MSSRTSNGSSTTLVASSNTNTNPSRSTHILTNIFGRGSNKDPSPPYPDVILRVQVLSCHDLAAKDSNGFSDPFVVVSVLGKQHQTPVCRRNLNPVYESKDATFDFPISMSLAHELGALEFVVWDKDTIKNDYLGKYAMPVVQWFCGTAFAFDDPNNKPFYVDLVSKRRSTSVRGNIRVKVGFDHHPNSTRRPDFGETYKELTKLVAPTVGIVVLEIYGAKDLPEWPNAVRKGWDMDPFVQVSFGSKVVATTPFIQHSLDPVWDDRQFFHVQEPDLMLPIRLTVFDHDTFTSNDYVGEAVVDIATLVELAVKKHPTTPDDLPTMHKFELPLTISKKRGRVYKTIPTITFRASYRPYGALRQQLR